MNFHLFLMDIIPGVTEPSAMEQVRQAVFLTALPAPVLVIAGLVLVVALLRSYQVMKGSPPRRLLGLMSLRGILGILLMILLLEPGLIEQDTTREADRVVVAVDSSSSMKEGASSTMRRYEWAREVGENVLGRVSKDSRFVGERIYFDEDTRAGPQRAGQRKPVDDGKLGRGEKPSSNQSDEVSPLVDQLAGGSETNIASAISYAKRAGDGHLAGLVVITDGNDTGSREAAEWKARATELNAPIFTVLTADPVEFKDISIESTSVDDFAFVRNPTKIQVTLRHHGFSGSEAKLTLLEDGKTVAVTSVGLTDELSTVAEFTFEPKEVGKHIYTVRVPVHPDERIEDNNRVDFAINIIRDRIRVLQVAGKPSWDERFVRRLLKQNPSVDLISFFILRSRSDNINAGPGELSLIPFPTRELFTEELHTFDIVILQDFNYRAYQMGTYLKNIRDFVTEHGGGLILIGGELSFSEAAYANTPVADVLPVRLFSGPGHIDEAPFRPALTAAGRTHPITQLGTLARGDNPFASLPKLQGVNLVESILPEGQVLLSHPSLRASGSAQPVLAVREVGKGRTMSVFTDSTWRWSLPHVGEGGRGDVHRKIFANGLRWLIRDPELSRLQLTAAENVVVSAKPANILVQTFDPKYRALPNKTVKFTLVPLDAAAGKARQWEDVTGSDGRTRLYLDDLLPGAYRLRAVATLNGVTARATEAFVISKGSLESKHLEPSREIADILATASGGQVVSLSEDPEFEFVHHDRRRVHHQTTRPLWDTWWVALLLGLVAGLEWWWRRRSGLA